MRAGISPSSLVGGYGFFSGDNRYRTNRFIFAVRTIKSYDESRSADDVCRVGLPAHTPWLLLALSD